MISNLRLLLELLLYPLIVTLFFGLVKENDNRMFFLFKIPKDGIKVFDNASQNDTMNSK